MGDGIVIDEGTVIDGGSDDGTGAAGDTQGEEGELEIDMDEGEGLPDGENDPKGGELELDLDLEGERLETGEEELAPVTEAAMNAGTQADPIVVTTWSDLKDKLSGNAPSGESDQNPTHYQLGNDIQPGQDDTFITVKSGRHIVLDLNGNTIDRGLTSATSSGYVIRVNGNLTITGDGTITGGYNSANGGVYVNNGGTFTMNGGTISDNTANCGGGVFVGDGTFILDGGTITGNHSTTNTTKNGGGVYVSRNCTFTMISGTISNNNAEKDGGGVYVNNVGTFSMTGGTITGNRATSTGGGVRLFSGTKFNLSGKVDISGNTKGSDASNVVLYDEKKITVSGKLENEKPIGVSNVSSSGAYLTGTFTSGFNLQMPDADPADYFESETDGLGVLQDETMEAKLAQASTITFDNNRPSPDHKTKKQYVENGGGGLPALKPNAFTWRGHTFNGWNTEADGTGTGKCTIWAIANNGVRTSVKVTVK